MKIISCEQRSSDWMYARLGHATGSHCADILGFLKKGGETQKRSDYKWRLVCELLTKDPWKPNFVTPEMQWGIDYEDMAVAQYEMITGATCDEVGFVLHETITRMGGSPDRLVGADGMVEAKCPTSKTHLQWLYAGIIPEEHEPQMSFYLSCTGRKWCDFISFDPRLPRHLRLFVRRLHRDEERIAEINAAVIQFNSEVDDLIARLNEIAGPADLPPLGKTPRAKLEEQLIGSLTEDDFKNLI